MNEIQIMPKVTLVHGNLATNRNAHLLRCESQHIGCNVFGVPAIPDPKNYRQVYRIKKDYWDEWQDGKRTGRKKKGYSWVEINHGMGGPGGVHRSVRALIIASLFGIFERNDHRIIYEGEEAAAKTAA